MLAGCGPRPATSLAKLDSPLFSEASVIGTRGTGPGQFNKPRTLAVDRDGCLHVADMTGRVQRFSPDGRYLSSWVVQKTDLGKPKGMGLDREANVIVIEPHYQRVNHVRPDGQLVLQWGKRGTNDGEFSLPRAVAVTPSGRILVAEYTVHERVQVFDATNRQFLFSFGKAGTGPGEFNRVEGLALDHSNHIYVADSCNHRVQVFDENGRFLRTFGRPGRGAGEMSYPYDVKVDAEGRVFVCEFGNSRVQIFDAQGRPLGSLGGPGAGVGCLASPWTIALDQRGNVYVADALNHRVQRFNRR